MEFNTTEKLIYYRDIIKIQNKFIVPIEQRAYKWKKVHIEKFLDAIWNSEGNIQYGLLSLHSGNKIVDGQQRLSTISIIESLLNNKGVFLEIFIERYKQNINEILINKDMDLPTKYNYFEAKSVIIEYFRDKDINIFYCKLLKNLQLVISPSEGSVLSEFININGNKIPFELFDKIKANQIKRCLNLEERIYILDVYSEISKYLYSGSKTAKTILKLSKLKDSYNILTILYPVSEEEKQKYYDIDNVKFLEIIFNRLFNNECGYWLSRLLYYISKGLNKTVIDLIWEFKDNSDLLSLKNLIMLKKYRKEVYLLLTEVNMGRELLDKSLSDSQENKENEKSNELSAVENELKEKANLLSDSNFELIVNSLINLLEWDKVKENTKEKRKILRNKYVYSVKSKAVEEFKDDEVLGFYLSKFKLIIPRIQRDYTLGSSKERLTKLISFLNYSKFRALRNSDEDTIDSRFNDRLSPFIGHCNGDTIAIYDGQQRLVTMMLILSTDSKYRDLVLSNFRFEDENKQEEFISAINKIEQYNNYTGKSLRSGLKIMKKLFEESEYAEIKGISDYLFDNLELSFISCKEISDLEQLMIDMNDTLEVKEYEIDRAKMNGLAEIDNKCIEWEIIPRILKAFRIKREEISDTNLIPFSKLDYLKNNDNSFAIIEETEVATYKLLKYLIQYTIGNDKEINKWDKLKGQQISEITKSVVNILNKDLGNLDSIVFMDRIDTYKKDLNIIISRLALAMITSKVPYTNRNPLLNAIFKSTYGYTKEMLEEILYIIVWEPIGFADISQNNECRLTTSLWHSVYLCEELLNNIFLGVKNEQTAISKSYSFVEGGFLNFGKLRKKNKESVYQIYSSFNDILIRESISLILKGQENKLISGIVKYKKILKLLAYYIYERYGNNKFFGGTLDNCTKPKLSESIKQLGNINNLISEAYVRYRVLSGFHSFKGNIIINNLFDLTILSLINDKDKESIKAKIDKVIVCKYLDDYQSIYNIIESNDCYNRLETTTSEKALVRLMRLDFPSNSNKKYYYSRLCYTTKLDIEISKEDILGELYN